MIRESDGKIIEIKIIVTIKDQAAETETAAEEMKKILAAPNGIQIIDKI